MVLRIPRNECYEIRLKRRLHRLTKRQFTLVMLVMEFAQILCVCTKVTNQYLWTLCLDKSWFSFQDFSEGQNLRLYIIVDHLVRHSRILVCIATMHPFLIISYSSGIKITKSKFSHRRGAKFVLSWWYRYRPKKWIQYHYSHGIEEPDEVRLLP